MCKIVDIFVAQTGLLGHFNSLNFRPYKIDKSWIASPSQARNDRKHFRPNVLLKGTLIQNTTVPEKVDMYLMVYVERLELATLVRRLEFLT